MLAAVIAPLYVSWRVWLASRMPITDCDEVYNYWEPLHYLLYHRSTSDGGGGSMQTWEYAHEYALRTYGYLLPLQYASLYIVQPLLSMSSPALAANFVGSFGLSTEAADAVPSKVALFVMLRALLAALTACAELFWLYSLVRPKQTKIVSDSSCNHNTVVIGWTAVLLCTCSGMNHAAGAFLPSATWMGVWCVTAACLAREWHFTFVTFSVVATLSTGWPFGAVCVVPMAMHILYKEYGAGRLLPFLSWIVAVTVVVQCTVLCIDYQHYGIWTSPTVNIITYNAGGSGDELYGIEPTSYYVKNLLLNLNLMAVLGVVAIPIYLLVPSLEREPTAAAFIDWNIVSMLLCLPAWFAVTIPRPHKEERFLFPVYPVLVFGAVLTVDTVLTRLILPLLRKLRVAVPETAAQEKRQQQVRVLGHVAIWIPVILISLCRTAALQKYYSAPLAVYSTLSTQPSLQTQHSHLVCTCGEWYRFPSSFYLPTGVQLGFLPSSFTGQLPQAFSEHGSRQASQAVLQPFNDRNLEQKERYVSDVTSCGWIVDMADGECVMTQLPYSSRATDLASVPFLDAERTSTLHRTLYLPFQHEKARQVGRVTYQDYVLYKIDHNIH